jgi:ABC-type phosphate/phosphonate transport system substrate-binding protein
MKTVALSIFCLLAAAFHSFAQPLQLVVMDPLSKDLACACVKGYAQRNYKVLAAYLQTKTGMEVQVSHGETLADALKHSGGSVDILIGKFSVIQSEAKKNALELQPVCSLTNKQGSSFQRGLLVVRKDSPARQLNDLQGFRVYFGPEDCDEKSAAAKELLQSAEIAPGANSEISASCSSAAEALLKLEANERAVALISSYAEPLLAGCGTIKPGDLRVVAKTREVPFITAFLNRRLPSETMKALENALLSSDSDAQLLEALESLHGFVEPELSASTAPAPKSGSQAWPQFRGPKRDGSVSWLPDSLPAVSQFLWSVSLPSDGVGGIAATEDVVVVGGRNAQDKADVFFCSTLGRARNAGVLSIRRGETLR